MFKNNRSHVSTYVIYALKYDLVIQRKKIRFGSSFTLNETLAYLYKSYIRNNKFLLHTIWKTIKSCCKINHSTKMKYFLNIEYFFGTWLSILVIGEQKFTVVTFFTFCLAGWIFLKLFNHRFIFFGIFGFVFLNSYMVRYIFFLLKNATKCAVSSFLVFF